MLCFVVKHAGSSLSMKEMQGEKQDVVKCFFPLVKCSSCFLHALQHDRAQSWLLYLLNQGEVMRMKNRAVKNVTPSKFTICNSLQTEIVQQVEFNTVA